MGSQPPRRVQPVRVPAAYGRVLINRFGATAAERAALLHGVDVSEQTLDVPGADLRLADLLAIVANVTRRHGEQWALDAPQAWSNAMQGALDVAARSAATAGDALSVLARYGRVRAPYLSLRLTPTRAGRELTIGAAAEIDEATWRAVSYAVALSIYSMMAQILDDAIGDARIYFPCPPPVFAARLRAAVRCELKFDAPRFAITVPESLCRRASPFADPALHAAALHDLDQALQRMAGEDTLAHDVARLIAGSLPRRLGEEDVARMLGLSRRSLVRRLSASGLAYRAVLEGVLRERAEAWLAQGSMTRDDMAAALGYADPTSFSRACRRWFGGRQGAVTRALDGGNG